MSCITSSSPSWMPPCEPSLLLPSPGLLPSFMPPTHTPQFSLVISRKCSSLELASPWISLFMTGKVAGFKILETIEMKPEIDVYNNRGGHCATSKRMSSWGMCTSTTLHNQRNTSSLASCSSSNTVCLTIPWSSKVILIKLGEQPTYKVWMMPFIQLCANYTVKANALK